MSSEHLIRLARGQTHWLWARRGQALVSLQGTVALQGPAQALVHGLRQPPTRLASGECNTLAPGGHLVTALNAAELLCLAPPPPRWRGIMARVIASLRAWPPRRKPLHAAAALMEQHPC